MKGRVKNIISSYYIIFAVIFGASLSIVKSNTIPKDDFLVNNETLLQNRTSSKFIYKSNIGNIVCEAAASSEPKSLQEIQAIVQYALQNQYRVKPLGTLHSINDVICTDGIAVLMSNINHFYFDPETNLATAGAGLQLLEFMIHLDEVGRSLEGTPLYGGITIGGVIGTGAHGSSLRDIVTLSDQIVSLTFVDGLGNVRTISAEEEDFKAFKVHLGLLGIIYECVFKTVPQYKIEIKNVQVNDDILWRGDEIIRYARSFDKFTFSWYPMSEKVVFSQGTNKPLNASGDCENHIGSEFTAEAAFAFAQTFEIIQTLRDEVSSFIIENYSRLAWFKKVPLRTPIYTKKDGVTPCLPVAVGKSYRMLLILCKQCPWSHGDKSFNVLDVSIGIPVEELPNALNTIKDIMGESLLTLPTQGMLFRFVKGSDAYMSMGWGRDIVEIEMNPVPRRDTTQPMLGITAVQAIARALIEKHDGRPHWGKNPLYYTNPKFIRKSFPEYRKFVEVMEKMDPHEIFMNDMGERIKNGKSKITLRPDMKIRCALNDACECYQESDCGNGGPRDFTCGKVKGFNVCKRKPSFLEDLKEVASRNAITAANGFIGDIEYIWSAMSAFQPLNDFLAKKSIVN